MKRRNPLFVGGFPYTLIFVGYFTLLFSDLGEKGDSLSSGAGLLLAISLLLILVGSAYGLYWLISTARVLRRATDERIPYAILLIIPLANYWWMWRYSQAAEKYTAGKLQTALGFLVIVLLGNIGMAIVQDYFNKADQSRNALDVHNASMELPKYTA